MIYRRGKIWWYRFVFKGATIRESTGLRNKEAARAAEDKRHTQLRESRAGVTPQLRIPMFSLAADVWLKAKTAEWAPKTAALERTNLTHLRPFFDNRLLSDIGTDDVGVYRQRRLDDGAAPRTVSLEIGTLRGMLLHFDLDSTWAAIKKKIKLGKARKVGRVITTVEEAALLRECRASRSRALYVAIVLALQTAMRHSEIRLLQWRQIDLARGVITVGESKTDAGEGRVIPLTRCALEALGMWAANFPDRKPNHFVFPSEHDQGTGMYRTDPTRPITLKKSWEAAKTRAGVSCRFHDLRHTACTRLLEAGVSHPIVAEIMGWSASTAILMIKSVYGHIGLPSKQQAMAQVEQFMAAQKTQNTLGVGTKLGTIEEAKIWSVQ